MSKSFIRTLAILSISFSGTFLTSCATHIENSAASVKARTCIFPPYLNKGDKVAIISPAGKTDSILLNGATKRLKSWGFSPYIATHAANAYHDYSGTSAERLEDIQRAFDDPETKAILCSRGGYGIVHYMDRIDFTKFKKNLKWVIGYSDVTALHCLLQSHSIASIHAPMAEQMTCESDSDKSLNYLKDILLGHLPQYHINAHPLNHTGKASGILAGGNMSVYHGLRGTRYDIPAKGTILFIEDVGEHYHTIERILYNLKLGGVLDNLSGLIIGQLNKMNTEEWMNGKDIYYSISEMLKDYHYPICFDFPTGHVVNNYPLIEGAKVELNVDKNGVDLHFITK